MWAQTHIDWSKKKCLNVSFNENKKDGEDYLGWDRLMRPMESLKSQGPKLDITLDNW